MAQHHSAHKWQSVGVWEGGCEGGAGSDTRNSELICRQHLSLLNWYRGCKLGKTGPKFCDVLSAQDQVQRFGFLVLNAIKKYGNT